MVVSSLLLGACREPAATPVPAADSAAASVAPDAALAPPPEIEAWLRATGVPIATADPTHALDDLVPLAAIVGDAHVVGMGEATHGTREFFQLKHRVLEELVAHEGFTVLAMEANQPECRAINAYILGGDGDVRELLRGIYFWTWDTEEVRAMIEWMRAWNADPAHRHKVQFAGFDMQETPVALASVEAFVRAVDRARAGDLFAPLALYRLRHRAAHATPPAVQAAARAGLAPLVARFAEREAAWRRAAGDEAYDRARQDLRVLEQAAEARTVTDFAHTVIRDRAMADNLAWIRAHQPAGTRVMLWAHNGHIARDPAEHVMGALLRERLGTDYLPIGFVYGDGSFQAREWLGPHAQGDLREWTQGPAPTDDLSTPFTATGAPILLVDLRRAPAGVVVDWLAAPHPAREYGAQFTDKQPGRPSTVLTNTFDAVLFVAHTTRARPLPGPVVYAP